MHINEATSVSLPHIVRTFYHIPCVTDLQTKLQASHIHGAYNTANFRPIRACQAVSRKPRVVVCRAMTLHVSLSQTDVLQSLAYWHLRPALPQELISIAIRFPFLAGARDLIALGSVFYELIPLEDKYRALVAFWNGGPKPRLSMRPLQQTWNEGLAILGIKC